MRRIIVLFAAVSTLLVAAGVPIGGIASAGGHAKPAAPAPPSGFASEKVWNSATDDWEPMVAADPSSNYLYQMTTRYGGVKACGKGLQHCIYFRASSDNGTTWGSDFNMCNISCKNVQAQNDPVMKVASDGTIYAVWMNDYDVMFSKSSNHGATWTAPIDFRTATGLSFTDKPELEISSTGQDVYVGFNASDSYIVASHNFGASFGPAMKTNSDGLYWFAEGGAVASSGNVYFAESAENQNSTGQVKLAVIRSTNGGASWTTTFVDTSEQQPACPTRNCPADFYGAQINLAVDSSGKILAGYDKNTVAGAPMSMYTRTSTDGVTWSAPTLVASGGTVGTDFPVVTAGPTAGDFRIAWQDDTRGATSWNTWFRRTTDGGGTFSTAVRLSDLGSGAPYKNANGYTFPYGDYFAMSTDSDGTNNVIWSEGTSYNGPGGSWYIRGT